MYFNNMDKNIKMELDLIKSQIKKIEDRIARQDLFISTQSGSCKDGVEIIPAEDRSNDSSDYIHSDCRNFTQCSVCRTPLVRDRFIVLYDVFKSTYGICSSACGYKYIDDKVSKNNAKILALKLIK